MSRELVRGIDVAYRERTDLVVFALTGRTGSGCTTAAEVLCRRFDEVHVAEAEFEQPEQRKLAILKDFARVQWRPFRKITVSTVIFSFLIQEEWTTLEACLLDAKIGHSMRQNLQRLYTRVRSDPQAVEALAAFTNNSDFCSPGVWAFFRDRLEAAAREFRTELGAKYPVLFQTIGDNLRLSGRASSEVVNPDNLFSVMRRVRALINSAREADRIDAAPTTRIVIDAVRNPLELVYLRDHFAGLFVIAVTVDDEVRRQRLVQLGFKIKDIEALDEKEYGKGKHLDSYASFVSQSLMECMQKADIFVENPGLPEQREISLRRLNAQLLRYVMLCIRPGLVTPTRDERCMQAAFVAKLNSGCISRQVGAAVADEQHSIQAIGWNDVPKGQVPCLLRDVDALLGGQAGWDFSTYEQTSGDLREVLKKNFVGRHSLKDATGLRCPFCFKDAYNELKRDKNQVHTRSLHAEENAFLQLARRGGGSRGGYLYTTASPCELCSKKAFQMGIQEIVFVDPYPGISSVHILASGVVDARPRLRLFSGAVGAAYHRLYEAILPIKDEYSGRLDRELQQALFSD